VLYLSKIFKKYIKLSKININLFQYSSQQCGNNVTIFHKLEHLRRAEHFTDKTSRRGGEGGSLGEKTNLRNTRLDKILYDAFC